MRHGWLTILVFIFLCTPLAAKAATTSTIDQIDPALDSDHDGYTDVVELNAGYSPFDATPTKLPKTIRVSLVDQRLRYYTGEFLVREIKVSTGTRGYDTPKGKFTILRKRPVVHYQGANYDYPNTKWNMQFTQLKAGGVYIHGAYWHNQFGKRKSHGCVNISYKDMEPLYNWTPTSTPVIIE